MPGPFSFWLLPGVIFHRHHAIFVLCEDNKWPNRYQQTAGGVSTDRGWERGPKCLWINWCSLSLTPRLSPPFQTCTTNTFNASNASFVRWGRSRRLIETDRRREWEIFTRFIYAAAAVRPIQAVFGTGAPCTGHMHQCVCAHLTYQYMLY